MFERFHRIEGAGGRTHEGTGIGLALVDELVRLHGGAVDVSSEYGVGTRFMVNIPFGSSHLPANRVAEKSGEFTVDEWSPAVRARGLAMAAQLS